MVGKRFVPTETIRDRMDAKDSRMQQEMAHRGGPTPEVLDALEQEVGLIRADSSVVEKFTAGLKAFFTTARSLEQIATSRLKQAQAFVVPATMEADEKIQLFIKDAGAVKKSVLAHWEISLKVSQFHKRLVAARKRSEEPLEQAITLATKHHNTYVDNERRRVAAENERLRLEAEQRAAETRRAELAELERQAVKAEEAAEDLSKREQTFVEVYMRTGDGERAAREATYAQPRTAAARLLSLQKILAACEAIKRAEVLREQAAAKKEQPLNVQTETVQANVSHAGGHDRSTHSAEILDERALINAAIAGQVPTDILQVNQAKLNEHARALREVINRWPGVRYKKTTSFV